MTKITFKGLKKIGFVNYYEDGVGGTPETSLRYPTLRLYFYFGEIRYGATQERSKIKYIEQVLTVIEALKLLEGEYDYSES